MSQLTIGLWFQDFVLLFLSLTFLGWKEKKSCSAVLKSPVFSYCLVASVEVFKGLVPDNIVFKASKPEIIKGFFRSNLSHRMTNKTKRKRPVRPAKTQISLGIRPVWSKSSLSAWRNIGPLTTYWAHSEDSDQTGRMPRLIWVFAGRTCHFVGFVVRRHIYYWTNMKFSTKIVTL